MLFAYTESDVLNKSKLCTYISNRIAYTYTYVCGYISFLSSHSNTIYPLPFDIVFFENQRFSVRKQI